MHPIEKQLRESDNVQLTIKNFGKAIDIHIAGSKGERHGFSASLDMNGLFWYQLIATLVAAIFGKFEPDTKAQAVQELSPSKISVDYWAVENAIREAIGKVIDNRSNSQSAAPYQGPMPTELVKWVIDDIDARVRGYLEAKAVEKAEIEAANKANMVIQAHSAGMNALKAHLEAGTIQAGQTVTVMPSESVIDRPIVGVRGGQIVTPSNEEFYNALQQGNQANGASDAFFECYNKIRAVLESNFVGLNGLPVASGPVTQGWKQASEAAQQEAALAAEGVEAPEALPTADEVIDTVWAAHFGDTEADEVPWKQGYLTDVIAALVDNGHQDTAINRLADEVDETIELVNASLGHTEDLAEEVQENWDATKQALATAAKGFKEALATVESKANSNIELLREVTKTISGWMRAIETRFENQEDGVRRLATVVGEIDNQQLNLIDRVADLESHLPENDDDEESEETAPETPLSPADYIDRLFNEL